MTFVTKKMVFFEGFPNSSNEKRLVKNTTNLRLVKHDAEDDEHVDDL